MSVSCYHSLLSWFSYISYSLENLNLQLLAVNEKNNKHATTTYCLFSKLKRQILRVKRHCWS